MPLCQIGRIIILCILILLCICILYWRRKTEGFQVPIPPVFACKSNEQQIKCPDERQATCCKVTGEYSAYIGLRKADSMMKAINPEQSRANYRAVDKTTEAYKADTFVREAYDAYQELVDAAEEANDTTDITEPPPEMITISGGLGKFDTSISSIPWDADLSDMLQSETVWGYVSPEASKSIWNKVYYNGYFSDLGNLGSDDAGKFTYSSPVIGIDVHDPNAGAAVAVTDFLLMNVVAPRIQSVFTITNIGAAVSSSTKKLKTAIEKTTKSIGPQIKKILGPVKGRILQTKLAQRASAIFEKLFAKKMAKFATQKGVAIGVAEANVAIVGAATAGAGVPQAQGIATIITGTLEVLSNIMMAVSIIMYPVLEQLIDGEGMCPPNYKSLQSVIPQAAETAISTFVPIVGDLIDLFYPYVCFRKPRDELIAGLVLFVTGNFLPAIALFITAGVKDEQDGTPWVVLKKRLEEQPYTEDSTLSVAYASQIIPHLDGNGVGILPPPLEDFKIQTASGAIQSRPWCNFANPIMLDRMANFYYKNALGRLEYNDNGTAYFTYISRFIGVVASSELSCDVVCTMTTVEFDPVSGNNVDISGMSPQYRRFYFIKGETDPDGYFTVTGCTNQDDTGPDATSTSADDGNYVPSLPKVFNIIKKQQQIDNAALLGGIGTGIIGAGLQMGGGIAGAVVNAVASQAINEGLTKAAGKALPKDATPKDGSYIFKSDNGLILKTINDYFIIDRGTVIETAFGYGPEIDFCAGSQLTMEQCTDQDRLRSVVDKYHAENPRLRIKVIYAIEPRGTDACYYKWEETNYDPATNDERIDYRMKEIILYYKLMDYTTCVWKMDQFGSYETAAAIYKQPRSIPIPVALRMPDKPIAKYPTRKPVKDPKTGVITAWVPTHPSKPFYVPRPLPPKAVLGAKSSCESRAQIEKSITDFNEAHRDKKIENVVKGWTSAPNRCDYLVDMLRIVGGKQAIQRESVSIMVEDKEGKGLFSRVSDGSDKINSGTFIQDTTPLLSATDTSGGVLGYKAVISALQTTFNNIIKPIIIQKPEAKLPEIASSANKSIEKLSQLVFNSQTLKACPQKKCADPDILKAIHTAYNNDSNPKEQYDVDVHTMTKILKAGVASDDECDVIFSDQKQVFSDILNDPIEVVNSGRSYRFKLTPTGDACSGIPYTVLPSAYRDVSNNAIGVRSESTTIYDADTGNIGFRVPPLMQTDCRKGSILTAIKGYLARTNARDNPNDIHTYKSVDWSFNAGSNICEYKVTKNVQRGRKLYKDVETYLRATVKASTLTAEEYDLDEIDIDEGGGATRDGIPVNLPFLSSYEESKRSQKVNVISMNFP